ncbi:MAG: hypothetical protein U5O39_17265 [Gammaproteobacteria bacterium]|nr:hypothetical protein [Gammaproteobacteria bacterium]
MITIAIQKKLNAYSTGIFLRNCLSIVHFLQALHSAAFRANKKKPPELSRRGLFSNTGLQVERLPTTASRQTPHERTDARRIAALGCDDWHRAGNMKLQGIHLLLFPFPELSEAGYLTHRSRNVNRIIESESSVSTKICFQRSEWKRQASMMALTRSVTDECSIDPRNRQAEPGSERGKPDPNTDQPCQRREQWKARIAGAAQATAQGEFDRHERLRCRHDIDKNDCQAHDLVIVNQQSRDLFGHCNNHKTEHDHADDGVPGRFPAVGARALRVSCSQMLTNQGCARDGKPEADDEGQRQDLHTNTIGRKRFGAVRTPRATERR